MNHNPKCELLNEYFAIISPLLVYESCEVICETEQKILALLCEIKDRSDLFAECWKMVESAQCLQTCLDVALLDSSDISYDSVAYDMKRDALVAANIQKSKRFHEISFVEEVKSNANMGQIHFCKLFAILCWLGCIVRQNKAAAKRIWSFLAMNGDLLSIEMLIHVNETEEKEGNKSWLNIKNILESEYNSFSTIATYSNYPTYLEAEVQTANLIMFISQKNAQNGGKIMDRPMIQYVLDSADDYATKMSKISSETNYYLVMHIEDKYSNKVYGF